jgi:hypothetical protein
LARILRRQRTWLLFLVAVAAINTFDENRRGLYPVFAKGILLIERMPWFERWNSFSRVIALSPREGPPFLWGPSPTFVGGDWRLAQSGLTIDGDAGTVAFGIAGELSRAEFLKYDVTNLAYYMPERHSAAVIGVGGGRDLLSARVFGVSEVTGVEINPTFVDLLLHEPEFSEFTGLREIDGITLVVDEARSWFARSEETFDVIQMSLIDTWAATGAGAFTLSENGLYTVEAWQIFLRRLNPNGVFTVSRWYSPQIVAEIAPNRCGKRSDGQSRRGGPSRIGRRESKRPHFSVHGQKHRDTCRISLGFWRRGAREPKSSRSKVAFRCADRTRHGTGVRRVGQDRQCP